MKKKKWSKTNIFAYLCSWKSSIRVTRARNNNIYRKMWKNGNKKIDMLLFTIWNLKSAITYKCGRVVLSRASVYFAISKLILLFSYSFHSPLTMFTYTKLFQRWFDIHCPTSRRHITLTTMLRRQTTLKCFLGIEKYC